MRMRVSLAVAAALCGAAPLTAAAATPAPGALVQQFAQNQLQNCAVICPYAAQGSATVPLGVLAAPFTFLGAAVSNDPVAALGTGAMSVTSPANAAMTGIIGNDLNQVVPRFQNGMLIAMVDLLRIGAGTGSLGTFRTNLLAALQEPLPPTAPTPPPLTPPPPFEITPAPRGPVEVGVVEATNVFFAAAFYVPELTLLGVTQTADAAASTLASTGDPVAAAGAGAAAARDVLSEDARILVDTTSRAASNIEDSPVTPSASSEEDAAPGSAPTDEASSDHAPSDGGTADGAASAEDDAASD